MRSKNSTRNIIIGLISQVTITLLGFLSRKIFLDSLGAQYLGINGLLDNVLSILALVEGGIGTSIVYHLYKPLAQEDNPKINALIKIYKRSYAVIAIIIFILSVGLYPFLGKLMKDSASISYITIAYFIFVAKNMTYYLNAHKVALINADQKGYVLANINFVFQVVTTISKIVVLLITKNYIFYLVIDLIIFIIQNILNGRIVDKRYVFIKNKQTYFLSKEEKASLYRNIKALFLHNIGTYAVFGTDNLLISTFIGITKVGLYSNYYMIIGQLGNLVSPLLGGIGSSIGNLIAIESKEKSYAVFKVTYLINFWIYSICVIFLYNLLEPFINWWLGNGYLLDWLTFVILLVNFYITGLRSSIQTFKEKGGIFVQDKFMPLIEASINLGSSLILVKNLGLAGIFIGTTISTLLTVFWNTPRLVYKNIFKLPVWLYFKRYFTYFCLTLLSCFITTKVCNFYSEQNGFFSLVVKGIICLVVPNIIYLVIFCKTEEFRYIKNFLKTIIQGKREKKSSRNKTRISS